MAQAQQQTVVGENIWHGYDLAASKILLMVRGRSKGWILTALTH